MGAKQMIVGALSKSPQDLCDSCLAKATGISPHQQVNQVCRKLAAAGIIARDENKSVACHGCLKFNIVNRLKRSGGKH
jgi:hypothetical protein